MAWRATVTEPDAESKDATGARETTLVDLANRRHAHPGQLAISEVMDHPHEPQADDADLNHEAAPKSNFSRCSKPTAAAISAFCRVGSCGISRSMVSGPSYPISDSVREPVHVPRRAVVDDGYARRSHCPRPQSSQRSSVVLMATPCRFGRRIAPVGLTGRSPCLVSRSLGGEAAKIGRAHV